MTQIFFVISDGPISEPPVASANPYSIELIE
jgi:hypothetical protein